MRIRYEVLVDGDLSFMTDSGIEPVEGYLKGLLTEDPDAAELISIHVAIIDETIERIKVRCHTRPGKTFMLGEALQTRRSRDVAAPDGMVQTKTLKTLGQGLKAHTFTVDLGDNEVTVKTGERDTTLSLTKRQIRDCLDHFGHDWFPLSNSKTAHERDPRGLGEYFAQKFGSSVFASHFAAVWVDADQLEVEHRAKQVWLKVKKASPTDH